MAEYSICKCIRTDKPVKRNGKYPIYLRVRVGFKDTKFPTNLDVWKEHWDIKKNEPKNKALLIQLNKKVLELDLYINRLLADGQELTGARTSSGVCGLIRSNAKNLTGS